ncbi:MAG: class I SAM-dependent methyltransferase [Bdellovibrionota bacterium]
MDSLEAHLLHQKSQRATMELFFWARLRSRFAIKAIQRQLGDAPVILDVGAGTGIFGAHLKEALPRAKYLFMEPMDSLRQHLEQTYGSGALRADGDYQDADAVVLLDVLEHQRNDLEFLRGLYEKMRAGALVVITVPAMNALWSEWDRLMGHYRRYSLKNLNSVVLQAGFEVIQSQYLFQTMVFPGLIRRLGKPGKLGPEFPVLSEQLNGFLFSLGKLEQRVGSWIPFGSSLGLVCRKK